MPTSYPDLNAKDKIRIKSYPVREWGEMIWAYMGPPEAMPELPDLEMALVPASHRYVSKKWQDCNWVQAVEGSIDTAHFTFAHLSFEKEENEILDIKKHFINPLARMNVDHMRWIAEDPRPVIRINPHEAGLTVAGGRLTGSDNIYWRIAQFLMPFHSYAPSSMPGENIFGQTFVPVTDTNCWIYTYAWNPERPLTQAERDGYRNGNGVMAVVDENYVPLRHKGNDYLIDRKLQKTRSYTGIKGVSEQDAAVQDSQGPIADRTREHLGPTDLGIMHFRKLVMEAARALQQGTPPPHVAHQDRYAVRSGACVTNKAKDLPAVMVERFGDPAGFVGRPRIAAAE
jgi:phenylpropionate dioxygenase-like ring-hydroxylating dioxygenase large terminal subunit